jgi:diacylglycerol kinase family enzyme
MNQRKNSAPKISCLINPLAARDRWQRKRKLRSYLQKNLPGKVIDIKGKKEDTIEKAKKQSLEDEIIVAVGGDGTVADVIQGIMESGNKNDVLLGLIPIGSGNAFRKSFRIPKKAKKAIKILSEGQTKVVDLIDIEGKMAGFASIGATARVTQEKLKHNIQGLFGHLVASRIMLTLPKKEQEIELFDGTDSHGEHFDRKTLKLKLFDCVIGKTKYFGYSWKIAPQARVDDGFLDITFFEISGWKYLMLFSLIYFGLFQKTQKHLKAKKMIIKGKDLSVQYNGEFLGVRDRIEVKVLPQALKIISPKKAFGVRSPDSRL